MTRVNLEIFEVENGFVVRDRLTDSSEKFPRTWVAKNTECLCTVLTKLLYREPDHTKVSRPLPTGTHPLEPEPGFLSNHLRAGPQVRNDIPGTQGYDPSTARR
jgi:hypothetical protein